MAVLLPRKTGGRTEFGLPAAVTFFLPISTSAETGCFAHGDLIGMRDSLRCLPQNPSAPNCDERNGHGGLSAACPFAFSRLNAGGLAGGG